MSNFVCSICKHKATYPEYDRKFHEDHFWECPLCFSLIAKKRYEVNVKDATTVFSPMGDALGDRIIQEVVRRNYLKDNPDENVVFLASLGKMLNFEEMVHIYKPYKVFWSDITDYMAMPENGVLWYSLCNEVNEYARQGEYSQLTFAMQPVDLSSFNNGMVKFHRYIVFHCRNIAAVPEKNMEPLIAINLWLLFNKYIKAKLIDNVIIVGNDEPMIGESLPEYTIDLRKKLKLGEIAWLCDNAMLYIGKDSGLAHLAARTKVPMVVYGYRSFPWTPKRPYPITAILQNESTLENVLNMAEEKIYGINKINNNC